MLPRELRYLLQLRSTHAGACVPVSSDEIDLSVSCLQALGWMTVQKLRRNIQSPPGFVQASVSWLTMIRGTERPNNLFNPKGIKP
jgi:hypothetical protein